MVKTKTNDHHQYHCTRGYWKGQTQLKTRKLFLISLDRQGPGLTSNNCLYIHQEFEKVANTACVLDEPDYRTIKV